MYNVCMYGVFGWFGTCTEICTQKGRGIMYEGRGMMYEGRGIMYEGRGMMYEGRGEGREKGRNEEQSYVLVNRQLTAVVVKVP